MHAGAGQRVEALPRLGREPRRIARRRVDGGVGTVTTVVVASSCVAGGGASAPAASGVADLDLAAGGQPAVVGGQVHVELGDERVGSPWRLAGALWSTPVAADRQLPPVPERGLVADHAAARRSGGSGDRAPVRVPAGTRWYRCPPMRAPVTASAVISPPKSETT